MRTTVDLPDALYRQLKAHAALQGVPMKDLLLAFVERGLRAPPGAAEAAAPAQRPLPTLHGHPALPAGAFSNAGLFDLLEAGEGRAGASDG
jgi:hypothetical protein